MDQFSVYISKMQIDCRKSKNKNFGKVKYSLRQKLKDRSHCWSWFFFEPTTGEQDCD